MKKVDRVVGRCLVLPADNIDTDQIIPGRFLKTTSRTGLGAHAFHDWRYDQAGGPKPGSPFAEPAAAGARILVAGANFGCGSSREHAPWALLDCGFEAVIARSFADIFRQNALKNGLLPVALPPGSHDGLLEALAADPAVEVTVDLERQVAELPGGRLVPFAVDRFARHCLLNGVDEIGYVLGMEAEIAAYERCHPAPFDTTTAQR